MDDLTLLRTVVKDWKPVIGVATFTHNLYTPYEKQCNLLFGALQAFVNSQKEEAYTKKTISTHNWRVSKELAVFEDAHSFSHPIISKIY